MPPKPTLPVSPPPKPPWEIIRDLRQTVISAVGQSAEKIDKIISPAQVTGFSAGFNDKSKALSVSLKIRRDAPFSDTETLWLQRTLADDLNLPVNLRIETIPFVPLLAFKSGDTTVTAEMKNSVLSLKGVYAIDPKALISVEAYQESSGRKQRALSATRLKAITDILEKECNIPPDRITTSINSKRLPVPTVKITVLPSGKSG
jgi:outer membrane protein OmpA-like peptidoglycan-associated protein